MCTNEMFTDKTETPPNPVDEFVNSAAVKGAGFYMPYEVSIECFQVKNTTQRDVGVALTPNSGSSYLSVNSDCSLSLGGLSHGYNTVFGISTDYKGHCCILTEIVQKNKGDGGYSQKAVALTLDDNGNVIATDQVLTGSKKEDQYWVATCTGDVEYDKEEKDHIKSASFKIESVSKTGFYLTASNNSICIGSTPTIWTLSMEPMKPQYLTLYFTLHIKVIAFYPVYIKLGL